MKRILFSLILSCFAVLSSNAQYCTPTYTSGCGSSTNTGIADYIDGVVTTGGTVNISNTSTACCGLANNYIFYSRCNFYILIGWFFDFWFILFLQYKCS
jgi:hypothetical protein